MMRQATTSKATTMKKHSGSMLPLYRTDSDSQRRATATKQRMIFDFQTHHPSAAGEWAG